MLGTARLVGALLLYLFVLGCGNDNVAIPTYGIGIVAFSEGYIGVIDPITQTVSGPFLNGAIGTAGGGSFDVVITPDRSTALVSNFGDSTIYFINISVPSAPTVRGSLVLPFFPEDIALTPNGRYALVTDGGFSPKIAVIDIQNRTLVETYTDVTLPTANTFDAVAVAADGKTVLTTDFAGGAVNTLTINDAGHLTYVGRTDISNGGNLHPVNISISPDGKTAIAAVVAAATLPFVPADVMRFPVLEITAPGVVELKSFVVTDVRINSCQSIVFNPSGTKAYALCNQEDPDTTDAIAPFNTIVYLDVTMPGLVSDSGVTTNVDFIGSSQLFGVDTIAMDLTGRYLYVSNMTLSAGINNLQVVDVLTGTVVKTITFDPVVAPPVTGTLHPAIPTGVFIR